MCNGVVELGSYGNCGKEGMTDERKHPETQQSSQVTWLLHSLLQSHHRHDSLIFRFMRWDIVSGWQYYAPLFWVTVFLHLCSVFYCLAIWLHFYLWCWFHPLPTTALLFLSLFLGSLQSPVSDKKRASCLLTFSLNHFLPPHTNPHMLTAKHCPKHILLPRPAHK